MSKHTTYDIQEKMQRKHNEYLEKLQKKAQEFFSDFIDNTFNEMLESSPMEKNLMITVVIFKTKCIYFTSLVKTPCDLPGYDQYILAKAYEIAEEYNVISNINTFISSKEEFASYGNDVDFIATYTFEIEFD